MSPELLELSELVIGLYRVCFTFVLSVFMRVSLNKLEINYPLTQGWTSFPKMLEPPQNSRRYNGDVKTFHREVLGAIVQTLVE